MKTATKWILGILIALVVLAVLAGAGYAIFKWRQANLWLIEPRTPRSFEPWKEPQQMPFRDMPMRRFWYFPRWNIISFFPLRLLACLVSPGILALILIGVFAYWLGRTSRKPQLIQTQPQPSAQGPVHTCMNCLRPVQEDWSHCPYCGTALK